MPSAGPWAGSDVCLSLGIPLALLGMPRPMPDEADDVGASPSTAVTGEVDDPETSLCDLTCPLGVSRPPPLPAEDDNAGMREGDVAGDGAGDPPGPPFLSDEAGDERGLPPAGSAALDMEGWLTLVGMPAAGTGGAVPPAAGRGSPEAEASERLRPCCLGCVVAAAAAEEEEDEDVDRLLSDFDRMLGNLLIFELGLSTVVDEAEAPVPKYPGEV